MPENQCSGVAFRSLYAASLFSLLADLEGQCDLRAAACGPLEAEPRSRAHGRLRLGSVMDGEAAVNSVGTGIAEN